MRTERKIVAAFLAVLVFQNLVQGADYFVNKQGNDANNGVSRQAAFLTIQKGVNALKPGDTLTIGPGEYFECVRRDNLGGPDADTVIRAEIPGTARLRGDVPGPEFEKVEGYRFIYAGKPDRKPIDVLDYNRLHTFLPKANVADLDFDPGYFYYEEESNTLYLSNKDLSPADQGRYTLCVSEADGIQLENPRRVAIEGLAVTGFMPNCGIFLNAPNSCTIRDCTLVTNLRGIVIRGGGSHNLIENCVCYGNNIAGIARYGASHYTVRNCYTYMNVRETQEHFGIMHYHGARGPVVIENNISWGQNFNLSVKPATTAKLQHNVALGFIRNVPQSMFHNLVGGSNEFDRSSKAGADNILFIREKDLDTDFEFADPLNMDYRLQPDSRFRGTAPDGSDRGPYPYKANVFYVSPKGNDQSDGLSMRKPWRTLARAFRDRKPGDTVYLTEGTYAAAPLNGTGDGKSPIKILGRARGTVVIERSQAVRGGAGLVFERLNFADGITLADGRDLTFKNCTFFGNGDGLNANGVKDLKATQCVFANVPVRAGKSSGLFLSSNLYANAGKPAVVLDSAGAVLYSDYNNYQDAAQTWQVGGRTLSFADVQRQHEQYSSTLKSELVADKGMPRIENDVPFKSSGLNSVGVGIHHEYNPVPEKLELIGPFLHSTSDTTANIEWWSSRPAVFSLEWGETPEVKNTTGGFRGSGRFSTFSLAGLKPGTTYYFKIVSAKLPYSPNRRVSIPELRPEDAALSFKTDAVPTAPLVYYVAPDGNDANDGLSRKKALRTINRAATRTRPGDTVMIAGGVYNEAVRIRTAGTQDRPITFRAVPGEKAVLLGENVHRAFELVSKPDIRFDGLHFRGHSAYGDSLLVRYSDRVRITRCLNPTVAVERSSDVVVKNCVLSGGWNALHLSTSPNAAFENNVFLNTILRQFRTADSAPTVTRGNIFSECWRNKTHQTLLQFSSPVTESDSCFYIRWPEAEKLAVNDVPLPIYRARTGSNAFMANPMLPGILGRRAGWQRMTEDELDFDHFFSGNPKLILRDIGLQPEAFADLMPKAADWPYDRAWAEKFVEASDAADALARAGKNAEALAAYIDMLEKMPMCDRLKSDVLDKASRCAERLKDYDRAMELAKGIPVELLAIRRQMELMLARKQYKELLAAFVNRAMGGRSFDESFIYPELETLVDDLYYYRSIAYRNTGDLETAEKELTIADKARQRRGYSAGKAIRDLTQLRLGDFYRDSRKDVEKALQAYLSVCDRKNKPVLLGDDETFAKATEAACAILRKQGKLDKVRELRENLAKAQADAAAALRKQ